MSELSKDTAYGLATLVSQEQVWRSVRELLELGVQESREVCCECVRRQEFHQAAVCAGKIEAFEHLEALITGIARTYRERGTPPNDD